jgi:trans-aconitate methyltransferase
MKWNASLYDNSHNFVSKFGESLLSILDPKEDETILDLGCGTGDLTEKIALSGAKVIGIDKSAEMLSVAKEKFPNINFQQSDAINFELNHQFDAIFSNAALHWILDKEQVIGQIFRHLKTGGRLVTEFGGKGNMQIMVNALKEVFIENNLSENSKVNFWYFPSIGEYANELEKAGFRVIFAKHFDRPTQLDGIDGIKIWFKMFGQQFFVGLDENKTDKILDEVQNKLKSTLFKDEIWFADYKRIQILAIKE